MKVGQTVAIWLHEAAAKVFLGLGDQRGDASEASRWVVVGTVTAPGERPIGVWVDVRHVEMRRLPRDDKDKRLRYTVTPSRCLIRWDHIITVQLLKDAEEVIDTSPFPGQYL